MDLKHTQEKAADQDAPEPKRQKLDEAPRQVISDEQRMWTPMAEPPDLNYRSTIETYEDFTDKLLNDQKMPFTQRCVGYDLYDTIWLERTALWHYLDLLVK